MLEPSATGTTAHRLRPSNAHWTHRHRELALGRPRIHGELLKLGFTISERTVSRYLRDRPTRRSQTWRTFLANHVGKLAVASTVTPTFAMNTDDAQSSVLPCRPLSRDRRYTSTQWAWVDSLPPLQSPSLRRWTQRLSFTPAHPDVSALARIPRGRGSSNCWRVPPEILGLLGFRLDWEGSVETKLATLRAQSGLANRWHVEHVSPRALSRKPIGDDSRNIGEAQADRHHLHPGP